MERLQYDGLIIIFRQAYIIIINNLKELQILNIQQLRIKIKTAVDDTGRNEFSCSFVRHQSFICRQCNQLPLGRALLRMSLIQLGEHPHTQRYAGILKREQKKGGESAPLLPCIPFWAAIIIVMIINERMNCFVFFIYFFSHRGQTVYIYYDSGSIFCVVSPLHHTLCLSICNACMYM